MLNKFVLERGNSIIFNNKKKHYQTTLNKLDFQIVFREKQEPTFKLEKKDGSIFYNYEYDECKTNAMIFKQICSDGKQPIIF